MKNKNQKTKDWEIKKLGEVCSFLRGLTYAKKDQVEKSNNIVLRANNINRASSTLNLDDLRYISDDIEIAEKKKLKKDSTLICTASGSKSHLGKVAFIEEDSDIAFGGFMGLLVPEKEIISGEYLFKILTSGQFRDHLDSLMSGANINNLKFSLIENFEVSFPKSLDEQKRIVGILDEAFENIDKAKTIAEQNLKNIEELFESELQNIFSNNSWGQKKVSKICKTSAGGTPLKSHKEYYMNGDIPWLRSGEVCRKYITQSEKYITEIGQKNSSAKLFPKNTVLVAMYGATAGQVGILKFESTTNQAVCGILPNENIIPEFLYYFFIYEKENLVKKAVGGAQPNISQIKIKETLIPFLTVNEQRKIVERLDELKERVDEGAAILRSKIAALDELKKSLLQKAFNGEL